MSIISKILEREAAALNQSAQYFSLPREDFSEQIFCKWLQNAEQIVFIGVGKSGIIAKKGAASFASLGFRAYFLHAAELMHGDLGAITDRTLAVFISFSGRGAEILSAANFIALRTKMTLALSAPKSALASLCAMNLALSCNEAIDDLPAPTSSTTLSLALCDALLAIAADFFSLSAADFAKHHPGGALGKRYYERVKDCLQSARTIGEDATLKEAICAMSGAGYALLLGANGAVAGFLSDGDLRRALADEGFSLDNKAINYASREPICVDINMLAHSAKELAKERRISTLVALDGSELAGVMRLI